MAQKEPIFKIAYPIVLFVCFFGLQEAWLPIAAFFTDLEVVTSRRIVTVVGYLFWALTLVVAMLMFDYFFWISCRTGRDLRRPALFSWILKQVRYWFNNSED